MSSLGSLVIEMAANTAKLQSDLGKAVGLAEGAADKIKGAFAKLGVGLFSGGIVAGLTAMTAHAVELGDELAKGAARAGITGGQFAELAAAAKQADVDIGTLSKGLKEIGTVVSSAFGGDQGAQKAIHDLGLSFEQLHGENATQQLMDVADALTGIQNPSDRARIGTAILGKSYLELVPLIEGGSAAIRENIDQQKRLGAVMSDEMVAKFSGADDSIKTLKASFSGFANELASHVVPAINLVAGAYVEMFGNVEKLKKIQDEITIRQTKLFGPFELHTQATKERLQAEISALQKQAQDLLDAGARDRAAQEERAHAMAEAARIEAEKAAAAAERQKAAEAEIAAIKKIQADINPNKVYAGAAEAIKGMGDAAQQAMTDNADALAKMESDTQTSTERMWNSWYEFKAKVKKLMETPIGMGGISADEGQARLDDYWHKNMVGPMEKAADDMSEYARQAARNIQDAFAQFLFDPFKDGINGLVTGFINAIRQMLANAAAAKIGEAMFGKDGSSGWLGALLSGISGSGTSGDVTAIDIGSLAQKRAAGGPVVSGQPYMVGERGPEWFTPSKSGYVHSAGSSPAGTDGGSMVVNYHIDARGATTDLVAALPGILARNNEQVKADLLQGIRRKRYPI